MMVQAQSFEFVGYPAVFVSETMNRILDNIRKIAASDAKVLITGESGSGKEVIARALHHYSRRCSRSWVDLNCAALPESLLESELFGHEKGAFSGADTQKQGLFEVANQGTLFLDEIGDLDARMQVKLLRILDGASYYRIGGVRKVAVDVRLVTATNMDLKRAVDEGRFRSDLYHRISQIHISVPPLRERVDDIIPLAEHFLAQQNPGFRFSPYVVEKLKAYPWPGNVRELRNVVVRAAVFASGNEIDTDSLPDEFLRQSFSSGLHTMAVLPQLEKNAILKMLHDAQGHQPTAAARLGISRRTLQRKLKMYRLELADRAVHAS
jgi:DNA-binding NtrC family response regulator